MDLGTVVAGGLIGAIVPVIGGLIAFVRLTAKLEEQVKGLRRDFDKLEARIETAFDTLSKRFDGLDEGLVELGERVTKLEVRAGA